MKIESEKTLERRLQKAVKKLGGLAMKFTSPSFTGVPDRVVLLRGKAWFAEMKSTGKDLKPRQRVVFPQFEKIGHKVWVIDTTEKLNEFLNEIAK